MNILCVVPSLDDIEDSKVNNCLSKLLRGNVHKFSTRRCRINDDHINIIYVTKNMYYDQYSGILIDIVIINDKNIGNELFTWLEYKLSITNGIMLGVV